MKTHLALLRGINVSGHNMMKMDALKKALEKIGFENVQTYIQSGNVFVDSEEENPTKVAFKIKMEIFRVFGHDVPVIVIGKEDLEKCFINTNGDSATYLKLRRHIENNKLNLSLVGVNEMNMHQEITDSVSKAGVVYPNSYSMDNIFTTPAK